MNLLTMDFGLRVSLDISKAFCLSVWSNSSCQKLFWHEELLHKLKQKAISGGVEDFLGRARFPLPKKTLVNSTGYFPFIMG